MAEEQIKITIDENGTFHAETHGLKGSDCLDALDELLGDLVGGISDVKLTKEYKQPPNSQKKKSMQKGKSSLKIGKKEAKK